MLQKPSQEIITAAIAGFEAQKQIIAATKSRWALKRAEEARAKRAATKRTGARNATLKAA